MRKLTILTVATVAMAALAVGPAAADDAELIKSAESAAKQIDEIALKRLSEARLAFIDFEAPSAIETPEAFGRGVELKCVVEKTEIVCLVKAIKRHSVGANDGPCV